MVKFGTSRRLKKNDIYTYLMEIFIVIFGITVAYQLNVYYEDKKDLKLEESAIERVLSEIEANQGAFGNLIQNRLKLQNDTRQLARFLFAGDALSEDSISHYLFDINKTYKPIMQMEALNFYLNTNYTNKNSDLKSDLLILKGLYLELRDVVEYYVRMKEKYYGDFLVSDVDFGEERIVSLEKIKSVEFKNLVVNLLSNELELNALLDKVFGESMPVQEKLEDRIR
ncbi:hypothetical protein [Roseivirga misakiensis]|uniref:Uncharacterized protein n=1 Tax=Roseivirga misakiensis TaxID=1563681 RepID=A0A1E5SK77_9BACT|nr:hypothetical protein [Roseivirga misakiensis]OEJ99525.1 hypothetical protein BFP71_08070 [Roseivirga misakiensis]